MRCRAPYPHGGDMQIAIFVPDPRVRAVRDVVVTGGPET